jgi:PleD family two-component response regulator
MEKTLHPERPGKSRQKVPEGLKVKGKAPAMMSARILIVDDEVAVLNTFGAFLVRDGYEVRTAADFDTALEIIRKENIDFILLDIMLVSTRA